MKNLKELKGVKVLSKKEQKVIAGGIVKVYCNQYTTCPPETCCSGNPGYCIPIANGACW